MSIDLPPRRKSAAPGARAPGTRTHGRAHTRSHERTPSRPTGAAGRSKVAPTSRTPATRRPTTRPTTRQPATRHPRSVTSKAPAQRPALKKRGRTPKRGRSAAMTMNFRAGDSRRRLLAVFVVSMLLFLAVVARVAFLQTAGSDSLLAAGKAQRVSEAVLIAPRGTIFARDGGELVLSVPSSTIYANPKLITDPVGVAAVLGTMLQLTPAKQQSLLDAFTTKTKSFVYVVRQIDDDLADSVMALNLAGVDVVREDKRIMPSGSVGRSLLGRTDIDGIGIAGLELQYDEMLTGTDGERVREHDAKGRSIPGSGATTTEPVPGDDLVLTIDRSLQFQVEQALLARVEELAAKGGAVVVMDTQTGEIYAIANVKRGDDGVVTVTSANLAAVEVFEPGSVAKVFSLSAVVDTAVATPDTSISVPGRMVFGEDTEWEQTINDAEPHDTMPMTLRDIIVHSSNIGTLLMTDKVGTERFGEYLHQFGFGEKTALDFPDESAGYLNPAAEWQGTEKVTTSYGYGYSVTALQLVAAVNTVANGGTYVEPKLVKAVIGADGEVVDTPASDTRQVLQPGSAATMTDMLTGVVCDGTGKGAQIEGISVAGKTGTAYKTQAGGGYGGDGNRAYRASFVGYFPAQAPEVTILVTIDEPDPTSNDRFGGKAAAPLFSTIATAAIHELQIMPTPGDTGCPAG
ncbi:MAG: penicillin-binding protein 2 [Actinomycetota bacterium]|nr:penicillin-binding protein 2 [Actinomycetota bacterium]